MDRQTRGVKLVRSKAELEEFCRRIGYTTDALANELEVGRATIFNWKKDVRGLPKIISLALFALEVEPKLRNIVVPQDAKPQKQYRRASSNEA
jgi:DNA-binding XRE family transcriptional regulator